MCSRGKLAKALEIAYKQLHFGNLTLADVKFNAGELNGVPELMAACPAGHRHWEWYHLAHTMYFDLPTMK